MITQDDIIDLLPYWGYLARRLSWWIASLQYVIFRLCRPCHVACLFGHMLIWILRWLYSTTGSSKKVRSMRTLIVLVFKDASHVPSLRHEEALFQLGLTMWFFGCIILVDDSFTESRSDARGLYLHMMAIAYMKLIRLNDYFGMALVTCTGRVNAFHCWVICRF